MPLGKPSSGVLRKIYDGSDEQVNRRTLRFLETHELARPLPGKESSRTASDWELTDEGRVAANHLVERGWAYGPGEFGLERDGFEEALKAGAGKAATRERRQGSVPSEVAVATWNLRAMS